MIYEEILNIVGSVEKKENILTKEILIEINSITLHLIIIISKLENLSKIVLQTV